MIRVVKVILAFAIIWQGIPRLIGIALRALEINYDTVIANELTILLGSLVFILIFKHKKEDYGVTLKIAQPLDLIIWPLLLQLFTIIGITALIISSAPLPDFLARESLVEIFFKYVIFVPLCEEIFMRGLIQTNLSFLPGKIKVRSTQLSSPVIATAVLFAMMHLFPFYNISIAIKTFFSILVLGLIAGYHREKTGSLFPAFIAHAAYNFWGGFIAKVLYILLK